MNTEYIDDSNFLNSDVYRDFKLANPGKGSLIIRSSAASDAVPIEGMRIIVSTDFEDTKIVFFDGLTDSSGMIARLELPAPSRTQDNLNAPSSTIYDITATYPQAGLDETKFKVRLYDGISVVQDIRIVPELKIRGNNYYGS